MVRSDQTHRDSESGGSLVEVDLGRYRRIDSRSFPLTKGGRKKQTSKKFNGAMGARETTHLVQCPRFPPAFNAVPIDRCKRRWQSAEAVAVTNAGFSLATGHNCFEMVTVANTTAIPFVDTWRIRKISVWTINYQDNATTATNLPVGTDTGSNNFNDREVVYTCSSRSEADPGFMAIKPALDTPLGCWHKTSTTNSTANLFILNVDYGGASSGNWATVTMDIDFEYSLNVYGSAQGYTRSLTGTYAVGILGATNWAASGMLLQGINVVV